MKQKVGIDIGAGDDDDTLTTDDRIDEEGDDVTDDDSEVDDEDDNGSDDNDDETDDKEDDNNPDKDPKEIDTESIQLIQENGQNPQTAQSQSDQISPSKPSEPPCNGALSSMSTIPLQNEDALETETNPTPQSPNHKQKDLVDESSTNPINALSNGTTNTKLNDQPRTTAVVIADALTTISSNDSPKTVSNELISETSLQSQPSQPSQSAQSQTLRSKPRKQTKSKSKKSKSKQNKSHGTSSSNNSDYHQLKKQYEGMVKLWNEERANLKKAQHLLRSQKDKFKMEQNEINESHLAKMDKVTADFELQIALKNKNIETLEAALLKVKEERNDKIEDKDRLNEMITELKAERDQILREKAVITKEKQVRAPHFANPSISW